MTTILSDSFKKLVFTAGVADYMHYKHRCPLYWRKREEETIWKAGFNHARGMCSR